MKTILIVDDDLDNGLSVVLNQEGYRVVLAENGIDGLDRVREMRPDLVVLDFMMPLMDGGRMGHALRGAQDMAHIKIVMSSSLSEDAVQARFAGYDGFLRKPYGIEVAVGMVGALLRA